MAPRYCHFDVLYWTGGHQGSIMRLAWLSAALIAIVLQGCSQQPDNKGAGGSPEAPPPSGLTAEQLKSLPMSEQLFLQSKKALEDNNPGECYKLLENAVGAARQENNGGAVILCRETQARLKLASNEIPAATKVLEDVVSEFDKNPDATLQMRLDMPRSLLAFVYAKSPGKSKAAETIYKNAIAATRAQKPVNHQRLAFWLKNYSQFNSFNKNESQAKALLKEAQAEAGKK